MLCLAPAVDCAESASLEIPENYYWDKTGAPPRLFTAEHRWMMLFGFRQVPPECVFERLLPMPIRRVENG
jgi:hypothetical protein